MKPWRVLSVVYRGQREWHTRDMVGQCGRRHPSWRAAQDYADMMVKQSNPPATSRLELQRRG